jgi:CRISPR/Cas system-associated exonuclease Cas4 (RecB family)
VNLSEEFEAGVDDLKGLWRSPPSAWSYSTLSVAEACPRRWMLEHASYPGLGIGSGYPSRPYMAAILGSVIHGSVERILKALGAAGCSTAKDPKAVAVMRALDGYDSVIDGECAAQVLALKATPRAQTSLQWIEEKLEASRSQLRLRTQTILNRVEIPESPYAGEGGGGGRLRIGVADGAYAEVPLEAPDLGIRGRADLLSIVEGRCSITDFKTGEPSESHHDQLRLYELLWREDRETNIDGMPVSELIVMYEDAEERWDGSDDAELDALRDDLIARMATLAEELDQRPPEARPHPDTCAFCQVRQLCDDFWALPDPHPSLALREDGSLVDCELRVEGRAGPRSWSVEYEGSATMLRTRSEAQKFDPGSRMRFLGLRINRDPDSEAMFLSETASAESFRVNQ